MTVARLKCLSYIVSCQVQANIMIQGMSDLEFVGQSGVCGIPLYSLSILSFTDLSSIVSWATEL